MPTSMVVIMVVVAGVSGIKYAMASVPLSSAR
jgi:hypothetical protein